jgi:3'-phosphoadenosine 5'-phosphosulfate sulfotransferase (PAPS reductase)/FAD synthetase
MALYRRYAAVTKSRYCSLYEEGYTSLGGVHNTAKNEALRRTDGTYAPAHELSDGNQVPSMFPEGSLNVP